MITEERWRGRVTRAERLRIKYFSEEEVNRLFAVISSPRDLLMFRLAYRHGLRASEVGMLLISDVNLKEGKMQLDRLKGSRGGVHALHPTDLELLKKYLRSKDRVVSGDLLFPSKQRRPIGRSLLHKLMKGYGVKAELPEDKCHFHALKHSIATHLISRGVGVQFVQEYLGHADIQNTLIYAKLTSTFFEQETRKVFETMQ